MRNVTESSEKEVEEEEEAFYSFWRPKIILEREEKPLKVINSHISIMLNKCLPS